MSKHKDNTPKVGSSGSLPLVETPPALDAIVDQVLAYKPPSSRPKKVGGTFKTKRDK